MVALPLHCWRRCSGSTRRSWCSSRAPHRPAPRTTYTTSGCAQSSPKLPSQDADRPQQSRQSWAVGRAGADWVDTAESADNAVPTDFNADDNTDAKAVDADNPRQTPLALMPASTTSARWGRYDPRCDIRGSFSKEELRDSSRPYL